MRLAVLVLVAASMAAGSAWAQTVCHYDSFAHAQVCNGPTGRASNGSNPWMRSRPAPAPQHVLSVTATPRPAAGPPVAASTRADAVYLRAQAPSVSGAGAAPLSLNGLANPTGQKPHKRVCTRVMLFAVVNCR
jgi:hypothetical protein